jgi:flagellar hook-associated protein 1 FlgK
MGLAAALNIGKTSLFANQKAIEIAGNNIANVNTEGYSRQKAVYSDFPSLQYDSFFVGQGVRISDITREHDVFISEQLLDKNQTLGAEDAKSAPLAELERLFSVGEENLATEIDRFFDSWQELSANPGGDVERDVVIQRGDTLAAAFNSLSGELDSLSSNLDDTVLSKIDGVNLQLSEIADLNSRILTIETNGQSANSFRDQRDALLLEVTYTLGVQSYEESNGEVNIQLPGGIPLVQGSNAQTLQTSTTGDGLTLQVAVGSSTFDVTGKNLGGEFAGLLEIRDELIPSLKDQLDLTAYSLVQEVNALHEQGVGLDGSTGTAFFTNPGSHTSQGYADATLTTAFQAGDINISVNGEDKSFYFDALDTTPSTDGSLNNLALAINDEGIGVTAVVSQLDDGSSVLTITPDDADYSIQLDLSAISNTYSEPTFTMGNMSELMAMSLTNTSQLAAGNSSASGDNTNALNISSLKDKDAVNGADTFVGSYAKMAAEVGIETSQNTLLQSGASDSLIQLQNLRDGTVGVSLEEEMIDLIKFQRGFEASAKLLTTVDEMLVTILSIKN